MNSVNIYGRSTVSRHFRSCTMITVSRDRPRKRAVAENVATCRRDATVCVEVHGDRSWMLATVPVGALQQHHALTASRDSCARILISTRCKRAPAMMSLQRKDIATVQLLFTSAGLCMRACRGRCAL